MWLKYTIVFLFFISVGRAQNDSLLKERSTIPYNKYNDFFLKKKYTVSYSKYNAYLFYDVVRCIGLGAEYRPASFFAADVKIAFVYPHGLLESSVSANDYFFNTGAGIMLTPKFYPGVKKIFFVGFNLGFYDYGYKNQWAESGVLYDKYNPDKELRDRQTLSFTLGPTLGFTLNTERNNIEFFVCLGGEVTSNKITAYDGVRQCTKITSPYSYIANGSQINGLAGIKFGFGFKREKYYAEKYYLSTLRGVIYNYDKSLRMSYRAHLISRDKLEEYYYFRNEQYSNIKRAYAASPKDTAALSTIVKEEQSKIIDYINKLLKNKENLHPLK